MRPPIGSSAGKPRSTRAARRTASPRTAECLGSPAAVAKARQWAQQRRLQVDFQVCGAAQWHWQAAAFDAVAAVFNQFAAPGLRAAMFCGMWRTLRPGGLLPDEHETDLEEGPADHGRSALIDAIARK